MERPILVRCVTGLVLAGGGCPNAEAREADARVAERNGREGAQPSVAHVVPSEHAIAVGLDARVREGLIVSR